ncbi:hypothetical protein N867_09205 [Actinotalea fermentans ATCC 43279 = JCM 9966 = DSM 3133]|uniref:Phage tail tape measure protein n=2 Tax=Actinotalea fermentans TaxID=43671 RepID=A0A511YU41_9CELL|nr:hypothetical protein N867_09205 [Actinotalea fermentans ATCC 43279 = JCM 9966 = DSM 3133]GEN78712.1 phage tail tape measure protein [Actinotalea fermentans]
MAERSLRVILRAEVQQYKRDLAEAENATKQFADNVTNYIAEHRADIDALANKVGVLGLAMVSAAGAAIMKFADFDAAVSAVAATGDDAAGSIDALRVAAIDAGQETVFSATEAAGAIENLAKAGVSAADILSGGLDGALNLAAAGGLDVAQAAEIASVALTQFGLSGSDVTHVADLLAAGAGKAMGDVTDLGQALAQGGQVAAQTGLTIEETTAALSAFASAGLLGSDAGTSLKTMLQRLTPQSAEAQQTMDELGISAYDAQGQFVGLETFAGRLQNGLRDLTPEARNAALTVMFGSDAVRAASVLYNQGAEGIRSWTEAVNDQGYAAEVAATRMDNLKGDVEQFTGALETALIKAGEGADGPLRSLVQSATDIVNAFSELPPGVQNATMAIVGGGGLVLLGVAGIAKLTIAVTETITSLKNLSTAAKVSGGVAAAALAVGTVALVAWADEAAKARARTQEFQATLDEFGNTTAETIRRINENLTAGTGNQIDEWLRRDMPSAIALAEKFGIAVEDVQGYILGEAEAIERVNAGMYAYSQAHGNGQELVDFAIAINKQAAALTDAERAQAEKQRADEAAGVAQDDLGADYDATTGAIEGQTSALADMIEAQMRAAGIVMDVMSAQAQAEAAYDDATAAIEEHGATLDLSTEAGRSNQDALLGIASAGWDLVDSMRENGAAQGEITQTMLATRDRFVEVAEKMGLTTDEAAALADELGLIPTSVSVAFDADTTAVVKAGELVNEIIRQINGKSATLRIYSNGPGLTPYVTGLADGGPIPGPFVGSTADNVLIRATPREYMQPVAAHDYWGTGFMDAVRRMDRAAVASQVQGLAYGGQVGMPVYVAGSQPAASGRPSVSVTMENVNAADPQEAARAIRDELSWAVGRF